MKKIILSILFVIFSSLNVFATQLISDIGAILENSVEKEIEESAEISNGILLDFGGDLTTNNVFSFYEDDFIFDNTENLSLWLKFPLSKNNSSFFAFEGFYDFSMTDSQTQESIFSNVLDVSLFKFALKFSTDKVNTTLNLGRFFVADTTGYILYQNADGIFANFSTNKIDFSIFTGYTGLINGNTSSYFNSPYEQGKGLYTLSPKYLIASTRFALNIFNTQFLNAEFLSSVDFGKLDYHKMYGTLTLNGTITQRLFYILQSTLGMNLKSDGSEKLAISNLSRIDFTYYFNFLESSITLCSIFASSEGTSFKEFKPITQIESSIIGTKYSSITKFGLLYTFKPVNSLFVALGSDCIAKNDATNSTLNFLGIQWKLDSKWQIVSDVFLAMQGQQFISFNDENSNYFTLGFSLGFSL